MALTISRRQISGRLTWGVPTRSIFLNLTECVWHASESDQPTSPRLLRALRVRQPGQALTGHHRFPFSFEVPEKVSLPESNEPTVLPASFNESGVRYSVEYTIAVQARRTGLSADSWYVSLFSPGALRADAELGFLNRSRTALPYARDPFQKRGELHTHEEMASYLDRTVYLTSGRHYRQWRCLEQSSVSARSA
jgi:hypothetical protein